MGLSDHERQADILKLLQDKKKATVAFLARRFEVSQATIRRDLTFLEAQGRLVKTYGGAFVASSTPLEFPYDQRLSQNIREKRRIGMQAANLVQPGDSVFLDSGTTALQIANNLKQRQGITVVTNGLANAQLIGPREGIHLYVLGGRYRPVSMDLVGPTLLAAVEHFAVDVAFLSVDGFHPVHGLTAADHEEADVVRAAIRVASRRVVVADSTKGGKRAFAWICGVRDVDEIISDKGLDKTLIDQLTEAGVRVSLV